MDFRGLAWSAFCFYYRSVGDRKYIKLMSDEHFISSLQKNPGLVSPKEFEKKIILELIKIYDWHLFIKHNLAKRILERIIKMQPELSMLEGTTILNCNLDDEGIITRINNLYFELTTVPGIWSTGASKILHLLNCRLFPVLGFEVAACFGLSKGDVEFTKFMKLVQQDAFEVTEDFHKQGFSGSPEEFLSDKIGYTQQGCKKPLVKFIDEYYWLCHVDRLVVPLSWTPCGL
jgi:hypothetical protein